MTTVQLPVLVVDDELDIQETLALLLDEEGYRPRVAASVAAAQACVDAETFALILTDLFARPPARLFEAVVALRAHADPTPVGLLTGWPVAPDEVAAHGFAFLVRKPFDLDELLTSVAAAVRTPLGPEDAPRAGVVQRYFAALSSSDWDGLLRLCTEDLTYVLPGTSPFAATVQGTVAFRAYTEETFRHFPAAHFDEVMVYTTPRGLAARYQAIWPMGDQAKQGEQRLAGAVVFHFEEGGDKGQEPRIRQIGVRLNEARLQALIEARGTADPGGTPLPGLSG